MSVNRSKRVLRATGPTLARISFDTARTGALRVEQRGQIMSIVRDRAFHMSLRLALAPPFAKMVAGLNARSRSMAEDRVMAGTGTT